MAAIRQEELRAVPSEALVLEFPTVAVRGRVRRERELTFLRRRVLAATLAVGLFLGAGLALRGVATGSEVVSRSGAPSEVRVERGMTAWQLAELYAPPGSDPRAYVKATFELNGVQALPPEGARIMLPGSS